MVLQFNDYTKIWKLNANLVAHELATLLGCWLSELRDKQDKGLVANSHILKHKKLFLVKLFA